MTFQEDIASDVQNLEFGQLITLYELDLTDIGLVETIYFTESVDNDYTTISFNGQVYQPVHLDSGGWETTGQGTAPRPKLRVSNVLLTFASHIYTFDDLVGAKLTRRRTLKKYLDGESEENPSAEFAPDIYVIRQKTQMTKAAVEFELSAYMDFEGTKIPKREIQRDFCSHTYRVWDTDTSAFIEFDRDNPDTTVITCTYAGQYSYTSLGDYTTDDTEDRCGKGIRDCEMRFGGVRADREKDPSQITISDTEPGAPSEGDVWLNTGDVPNIWYEYISAEWLEYTPDPLYTRAFPSVARFQP